MGTCTSCHVIHVTLAFSAGWQFCHLGPKGQASLLCLGSLSLVTSTMVKASPTKSSSSCDGQPVSPLASRVPKVRLSGDLAVDTRRSIERDAFVRIVDKLTKYPQYIMHLHGIMLSQDLSTDSSSHVPPLSKLDWTGNYPCLGKIPKSWVAQYLMHRALQLGTELTQQRINSMEEDSVDNLRVLFSFETQTTLAMSFPSTCHDKYIATRTFSERAAQVCNRLSPFLAKGGITKSGALDFSRGGCYSLHFEGERCKYVEHITGIAADVPPHVLITNSFSLMDNHSDQLARVELNPCKYYLMDFFKGADFLQQVIKDKKGDTLKKLAKSIADKHAEGLVLKNRETVQENKDILKETQQRRATSNLEKARHKLEEKKADRTARRTIRLG